MQEPKIEKQLQTLHLEEPLSFLEEAAEALHVVSPEGMIVWANKRELELLGYTKDEYIGHHIGEFFADQFVINDVLCRLIYNNEVINYPADLKHKDGRIIHVLLNSNVYNKNGEFVHARFSTRDVTDLRIIQTRIETSNARILNQLISANNLIDLIGNAKWQANYQGYITTPQLTWATYCGMEPEDQLGYGWLKAFHPDDRIKIKANLIAALKENRDLRQLAHVFSSWHNEYVRCCIFATPLASFDGKGIEWNFILVDQTRIWPLDLPQQFT